VAIFWISLWLRPNGLSSVVRSESGVENHGSLHITSSLILHNFFIYELAIKMKCCSLIKT